MFSRCQLKDLLVNEIEIGTVNNFRYNTMQIIHTYESV